MLVCATSKQWLNRQVRAALHRVKGTVERIEKIHSYKAVVQAETVPAASPREGTQLLAPPNHRTKSAITAETDTRIKTQPAARATPPLTPPSYRGATASPPIKPNGLPDHEASLWLCTTLGTVRISPHLRTQLQWVPPTAKPRLNSAPGPPHHPIEENGQHLIQPGVQGAQAGTLPKGTIQPLAQPCQGTPP
ncbi:unnamed protein product [Rangifer tarandus platyrhynchus]|uniref:Uncharacterized protein n=1 Tax=Rangifer tarandus platyrhynchus TaxID=3082113 RepID=A0ABN8Y5M5_RANTA|nr:unnamed protein product [Rangifer tarandus platyrhynchus]